jgi:uncharacterized protein YbaP (TraB family)
MKKYVLIHIISFLSIYVNGQLLWKISGEGVKENSYLYGTIHVMPENQFSISPKIQKAFDESQILAMEIDLNMGLAKQLQIAKKTILPRKKTIQNYLSVSDFTKVKSYCLDSLKISESRFKKYIRLKPFFFSSAIAQEQMGDTKSFEMEFNKMAKKKSKKTMGLETIEYQLQTINKISIEDQAKMLMDEFDTSPTDQFNDLLKLYLNEDLNGLYKAVTSESSQIENFNNDFLDVRNKNWIPVIEDQIKLNKTFIAVGAAHLPGENGVINLLQKKGYTLEPVEN